jgi:hypothetical protein
VIGYIESLCRIVGADEWSRHHRGLDERHWTGGLMFGSGKMGSRKAGTNESQKIFMGPFQSSRDGEAAWGDSKKNQLCGVFG